MVKFYGLILSCLLFLNSLIFAQDSKSTNIGHYAGKMTVGFNIGIGYNIINHVDGTLAVIPNKPSPGILPGSPVYSTPLSVNIDAPQATLEYWINSSFSIQAQTGVNIIVAGANHAISNFAYIFSYWKLSAGARYYLDKAGASPLFFGLGWFVNFPLGAPMVGFIASDASASITTGPYVEFGMNYPVTSILNIELFGRFYFNIDKLTSKSDANILADIMLCPLNLGFGLNWTL